MAMPPDMTEQDVKVIMKKCSDILLYIEEAINLFRKTNSDVKHLDDIIVSSLSVFMMKELVRISIAEDKSVFTGYFMLQQSMHSNLMTMLQEKGIIE